MAASSNATRIFLFVFFYCIVYTVDLVTAQAGKMSLSPSGTTYVQGLLETVGSGSTFPPAKSFPNNIEIPLTGSSGLAPTTTVPETKSVFNFILWRGTFMIFTPIPWISTLSPVALFVLKGSDPSKIIDWAQQVAWMIFTGVGVNIITIKWH